MIRNSIEVLDVQFQKLFTQFQSNIRKEPNYIKYDAFKDLKIIFKLYSETYHLKGFNYNYLKVTDIEKLLSKFDNFQKRELVNYLIKSLAKEGIEEKAKEMFTLLSKLEIKCAWEDILNGKKIFINFLKLLHNLCAYNRLTLFLSPLVFVLFLFIIYLNAPFQCMEIIHIDKIHLSDDFYCNHFFNILIYLFDIDDKVCVHPLNAKGVLLIIGLKSFFIIVVINFLVKEFFNRVKLQ